MKFHPLFFLIFIALAINGCAQNQGALQKDKARAMQELGGSSIQKGNIRGGLESYLKALELDPDNPEIHHSLALIYQQLGEYQLSLNHFQKTLALKPDFPEARNNLGTLYILLKEWDLAIEQFEKAAGNLLYQTPDIAYNNMGLAYYYKGSYQKAIESYRQAIKYFPGYAACYGNLALADQAVGDNDGAIEAYQQAIKYDPDNPDFHLDLGRLFLRLKRKEKAADAFNRVLNLAKPGPAAEEAKRLLDSVR